MLRPKKIIEGITKDLLGKDTEISDERLSICNKCPNKKGSTCSICGCILTAKTKVLQEPCPVNNWNDIKIAPDKGVAIRLHEVNKATIDIIDGQITITHKNTYQRNESIENTLITLDVVNLREDEDKIKNEEKTLTNLWLNHCSCYETRINNKQYNKDNTYKRLSDSNHIVVTIKFNTELDPKEYAMSKTIKLVTDQGTIPIKIKGEVL
jgi:hypothetical protein